MECNGNKERKGNQNRIILNKDIEASKGLHTFRKLSYCVNAEHKI